MAEPQVWHKGTRNPDITDTITSGGAVVDLTGTTVKFKMRALGSATLKVDAPATVTAPSTGVVAYSWAALDVDTAGLFLVWWEVTTTATGKTQDKQEALIEIRDHAPVVGNLCEVADVRQAMETRGADRDLDDQIAAVLPTASSLIQNETQREFSAVSAATRTFMLRENVLDLAPYDLRTATTVTLHPGTGDAAVITTPGDFFKLPVGGDRWGTYQRLRFASGLNIGTSDTIREFGFAVISILGDWGPLTVPPEAKQACIVTVRSWLRRDFQTYADVQDGGVQAPVSGQYALPLAAKSILRTLQRYPMGVY